MNISKELPSAFVLLPLAIFIAVFLGAGIILDDFYALPSPIAVIIGIVSAFLIYKGSLDNKVNTFLGGCGDTKILTMCLIYLLAGAFAGVSAAMGGVEAVVNLGMHLVPPEFLPVGVFLVASFLSISTGTSVGSIVALAPIVLGLAAESGNSSALMAGSLLGGAMFGDNLSVISDTTIAATQSLGVQMKDKFKVNIFIALPAAMLTMALLYLSSANPAIVGTSSAASEISLIRIVPYLMVIALAVAGYNVFVVLFAGIVSAGLVGIFGDHFGLLALSQEIYKGFLGMADIFFLSLLTGGLAALVTHAGGIDLILKKINKKVNTNRSAQLGIGSLAGLTNLAIANNTVSILVTGPVAEQLSESHKVSKKKAAALLDIFACVVQGLLPYGAQVLLILSYAGGDFGYFDLLKHSWYLLLLFSFANLSIISPALAEKPSRQFSRRFKPFRKAA